MMKLRINDKEIYATGSVITLFLYKQEFDRELLDDSLIAVNEEDVLLLSKILWSMLKTVNPNIESYIFWIDEKTESLIIENKDKIIYEIYKNILFEIDESKQQKKTNVKATENVELGMIKNIIDMNIELEIVNMMSVDTFLQLQDMYIGEDKENDVVMATPKQASAFFL